MKKITVEITGTRPMLMHNGRLANPLNKWVREIKKFTSKRKKTDEDLLAIMKLEARGGVYETEDEKYLAFPTGCVYASIFEAAKQHKMGKLIKQALRYEEKMEDLLINGKKINPDKFLSEITNIDYTAVKVGQNKVMRSRPIIRDKWQTTHTFELDEKIINARDLEAIFAHAGSYVGLGDRRPTYGTYKVKVV